MVNIFTRKITGDLTSLVKRIDETVEKNQKRKMAAFVVLLSDDPDADEEKLKALAKKENIKNVPLTVFEGVSGPQPYKVAKDAEVTVMMWTGKGADLKVNHAFRAGELNKASIEKIIADTSVILKPRAGLIQQDGQ